MVCSIPPSVPVVPMSFGYSAQQVVNVVQAANTATIPYSLSSQNITLAVPATNSNGAISRNTQLEIDSIVGQGYTGSVIVYYNRLDLSSVLPSGGGNTVAYSGKSTTADLLPGFNTLCGTQVEVADIVVTALPAPISGVITATLQAASGSYGWIGSVSLTTNVPAPATVTFDTAYNSTGITYSNGNMTATKSTSANGGSLVRATQAVAGKQYFEMVMTKAAGNPPQTVGIVDTNFSQTTQNPGSSAMGWGYYGDGSLYHNNALTAFGATYTTNDVIGVAIDATDPANVKIWFAKNNTWQGSGNPATGANPAYSGASGTFRPFGFITRGTGAGNADAVTAHFNATDQQYTPPSGFQAGVQLQS